MKMRKSPQPLINIGERFSRLVVVAFHEFNKHRSRVWECRCDCGATTLVTTSALRSGEIRSCGCLLRDATRERFTTHGMADSLEYQTWKAMKARCYNSKHQNFPHYGGRGIAVCEEWRHSFIAFLRDVGPRPTPKHTLERLDNNQDYVPSNVCWATQPQQLRNRRNNINVTIDGVTRCLRDWAVLFGVPYSTAFYRHKRGASII